MVGWLVVGSGRRGRAWPGWPSGTRTASSGPDGRPGHKGPCRSGSAPRWSSAARRLEPGWPAAPGGHEAAVEGQLAGLGVAADQQPALPSLTARCRVAVVQADERPVVVAVALGALTGRDALPSPRRDPPEEGVGAPGVTGGEHPMVTGHRQHLADTAALQLGPQPRVGAVALIAGHPGGRHAGVQGAGQHPGGQAGLVAKPTWAGMPAARQRSGSWSQPRATYSSRSIMACPASLA